jgi:hypothetical protein
LDYWYEESDFNGKESRRKKQHGMRIPELDLCLANITATNTEEY